MIYKFMICFLAGIGAGLGTGFAGMSAAAVISPMLITFLGLPAYEAVGIALASDVLASVLGYELKTAVGTSVFIMTFTALTGSVSHFAIGGMPDLWCLLFCVVSTLLWARIAAKFANKASAITLNRATGVVLAVLGIAIITVNYVIF